MDRFLKRLPAAFYRTRGGTEPVRDWLREFSVPDRNSIGIAIAKVEFGWPVGMPVCRPIASRIGLWEIRCNISSGRIVRILFCIRDDRMLLLHGFVKKTQRTADRDIELAWKRKKEVEA